MTYSNFLLESGLVVGEIRKFVNMRTRSSSTKRISSYDVTRPSKRSRTRTINKDDDHDEFSSTTTRSSTRRSHIKKVIGDESTTTTTTRKRRAATRSDVKKEVHDRSITTTARRQITSRCDKNQHFYHNKMNEVLTLTPVRSGWTFNEALQYLCHVEPKFIHIINTYEIPKHFHNEMKLKDSFTTLLRSIISQQLNIKVADTIFIRFCKAIGIKNDDENYNNIDPCLVKEACFDTVIDENGKKKIKVNGIVVGLSSAKADYIKSLAYHFDDVLLLKDIDFDDLSDEEVFSKLKNVKGLGEWSIHMFMIFYLHRPNVLPLGKCSRYVMLLLLYFLM